MRMNRRMSEVLKKANITVPFTGSRLSDIGASPTLVFVDGSLLLREEYEKAKHVKPVDFPDRTGFECFVNHVHLPYDGGQASLQSCLQFATTLQKGLAEFGEGRPFLVIVSVSADGCVVRFHQCRPNENWVADDLEGYSEEAILILWLRRVAVVKWPLPLTTRF
jgi:hypothetical protein